MTRVATSLLILVMFSLSSAGQDMVKTPEGVTTELFGFNVSGLSLKNSADGLVLDYVWDLQQIPNAFPDLDRSTIELSVFGLQVSNEPDQPTSFTINGPELSSWVENFTISGSREVVVGSCDSFLVDNEVFELVVEVTPVGTKGQNQIDGPTQKFSFPLTKTRPDEDCAAPESGSRDVLTQAAVLTPIPQDTFTLSVDNVSLEIINAAFVYNGAHNRSIGFLNFDFLLDPNESISIESIAGTFNATDHSTGNPIGLLSLEFGQGFLKDDQGSVRTINRKFAVDSRGFREQNELCDGKLDRLKDPQLEIALDLEAVQTSQTASGPQYRILLPTLVTRPPWEIIGACPETM